MYARLTPRKTDRPSRRCRAVGRTWSTVVNSSRAFAPRRCLRRLVQRLMLTGMEVARVYECAGCGGLVRESSRTCHYCRSPVASLRCAHCFTMNISEAIHCIGCGTDLGLMPLPVDADHDYPCPRCQDCRLDAYRSGDAVLFDCAGCGGQFIDSADLRRLIQAREHAGRSTPRLLRKENPLTQPINYVPCPACRQLMLRRNFGGISGVVVDVCAAHGTWFDAGELARVLAFAEAGGLLQAQQRQDELTRRSASSPGLAPFTRAGAWDSPSPRLLAFEASVRAFVRWVLRT